MADQPANAQLYPSSRSTCTIGTDLVSDYSHYIYQDSSGVKHSLNILQETGNCGTGSWQFANSGPATDGSGIWAQFDSSASTTPTIRTADGRRIGWLSDSVIQGGGIFSLGGAYVDANGNSDQDTPAGLDTLGRALLTQQNGTNQLLYTVADSSGTARTYTVNYINLSLNSSFGVSGVKELGGTRYAITSIGLPNGTSYSFGYDSGGELNSLTTPTGAVITYNWATFASQPLTQFSYRYISSRTVTMNGISSTWSFAQQTVSTSDCAGFSSCLQMTETDPLGNQTVYFSVLGNTLGVKVYAGTASGTPLRTYVMAYSNLNDHTQLLTSVTTQLENGLVSQKVFGYDNLTYPYSYCPTDQQCANTGPTVASDFGSRGNVTDIWEYDFGNGSPGPLLRHTVKTYLHDSNSAYVPYNIVNKVLQDTVYDGGGHQVAQTQYDYDNYVAGDNPLLATSATPAASHDYTNVGSSFTLRGNLTRAKRWRNTDGALLTTTYQYDDLGNVRAIKDARGNTTSYSYSDNWANSACPPSSGFTGQAYVYQITNALNQVARLTHYPCTGLLQASQDPNDINAGRTGTTYSYDLLGRITQKSSPDGGSDSYAYNDVNPASFTLTKAVTSATNLLRVTNLDGLGRVSQTQLTSDPSGTTYTATAYDLLGRVNQQFNPTRCNPPTSNCGESTWGSTLNVYDALGRVCVVTPPDGLSVSSCPSSQPTNDVFTSYSGNTTTVTDQAGHSRKSVTDALGRLVEVDEPGATSQATSGTGSASATGSEQSIGGTPAASGTGSVNFSGSLQNKVTQTAAAGSGSVTFNGTLQVKTVQPQAATSGTGTVTINGSESGPICDPQVPLPDCSPIYDSGVVSVTVNGFTANASYGQGSTSASVASDLNAALNGSGSPVRSSISGSTVTLTAKATGAASNYSLSATSSTNDPGNFPGGSFHTTTSGSTLTGGKDAVSGSTTYDSGTCTITVNSHGDSTSWSGSGTTTSSIASALASNISGDGGSVNASPSGGTVSLTARTTGSSTNYSLSSSCTYDSSHFSGPSFTTSNSGSTLTGGQDTITVYDSGTSTITVNGHADSLSWSGSGTTTSSIASGLASRINADSSASVSASASGATVSLTAKTTGASTNYSLSSSSTYDSGHFSSPSFSSSNSASTLTGGSNGTATVYDSGSVWIKVAGFQVTASYGQSDTTSSLATAFAGALNTAGSPVTASVSGTTISLTAKAAGANTNYTLASGSSTNQPSSFSQPSFAISLSGAALTGGTSPTLSPSTPAITTYNYDTLDNLISVTQSGSHQRTFTYDSLSRLICASNPENSSAACPATATGAYTTGTTGYSYDADGNVTTKTALAPNQPGNATVTTTYSYDALNRLTQKSYSDGTPTVKYGYDAVAPSGCTVPSLTIHNGIGKRTGMCDAAGGEAWSYDIVSGTGWKTTDMRTTSGVTLTTVVQDNLDGSTNSITYPSGHVVSYDVRGAGLSISATDTTAAISYAANAKYWSSGALSSLTNGGSFSSTYIFNSRLQPCWIYATTSTALAPTSGCSTTAATGNILDLKYNYNLGSSDNDNVAGITNNRDTTRSQTFAYDPLNRLIAAQTTSSYSSSSSHCWGESFGYDAWGNLLSVSESSSSYDGCTYEQPQAWAISAKNQIQSTATCFDGSGNLLTVATYCYDAAGNLLTDTAKSYSYDAENHIKSIPMLRISYVYDGDGKRVAKLNSSGQPTKLYWYGTSGDPLDETDGAGATNNSAFFEYAFFHGQRIARRDASNIASYYFADHLGTSRVVTNSAGIPIDDSDFYPFGGERPIISSSGNTYKFTGKERDVESGLDNFGARYLGSSLGRFQSPDPLYIELHRLVDPQRLNLYAYGRNNPLTYTDPTGLDITCNGTRCDDYLKALQKDVSFKIAYDKNGKVVTEGDIDKKGLSKTDKALLKAIDDTKNHVTINAIDGGKDPSVFLGRSDAPHSGTHTIAFGQLGLLDTPKNAGGATSAEIVGHETLEGYSESLGNSYDAAHDYANQFFGGLSPLPGGAYRSQGEIVTDITGNFRVYGTSTTESITFHFVTPIPRADFLGKKGAPYQVYPTDVEKKQ